MKRVSDILISVFVLTLFSPILLLCLFLVFWEDKKNPIYSAVRIGHLGKKFNMYKIRSMKINADLTGVESTSSSDPRITKVGGCIRKFKIDELSQFINVLLGEMSVVGPRPNTIAEVKKYLDHEQELLSLKPGITDISSIIFSNEGEILKFSSNPDEDYEKLIRPWKSELGLIYIRHNNFILDLIIIFGTALSIFSRSKALKIMSILLKNLGAREELVNFSKKGLMP